MTAPSRECALYRGTEGGVAILADGDAEAGVVRKQFAVISE